MNFYVSRSCAWAPGISSDDDWRQWVAGALAADAEGMPEAKAVPAMLRRRLTRWGRMALQTACACAEAVDPSTPVIFSSRHGDTQRTCELLQDLAVAEPLSPTAFSLSVHNASLGIYTIVQQALGPSLALAAGKETLAHALIEAHNWLDAGAEQVLLVHTDDLLAEAYRPYADEQDMPHSVALLLHRSAGRRFSLSWSANASDAAAESMSQAFLRWWFGHEQQLIYPGSRTTWTWAAEDDGKNSLLG